MFKKMLLGLSIEFGPILVFFLTVERINFITATTIFVGLTIIALIAGFIERRKIAWFPLIVGISVLVFGIATIIFKDPFFIIFKDTIYNGIFAIILFWGLKHKKGLLKPLFGSLFAMTDAGWRTLSLRWACLFTVLAVSNEVVRVHLTSEAWVSYKLIATLITILFSIYQFKLARQERLPEANSWGMRIIH